jgi:NADH-quinone oxidoreductase subunit M
MVGTFALTAQSVTGGVLQMINHGVSTGALFILAGFLYNRRHSYEVSDYGGLANVVPVYCGALVLVGLSSIGLPGLNGFVGEFLILVGSFGRHPWVTLLATTGVIFAAYYMLPMIRRVVWNEVTIEENRKLLDLSRLELAVIIPLLIMIVLMGIYPKPFIDRVAASAEALSERIVTVAEHDAGSTDQNLAAVGTSVGRTGTQ